MSTIALPVAFTPSNATLTLYTNQRVTASPFGGSEQAIELLNDRWRMTVDLPDMRQDQGAQIEAFIAAMRGQVNVASMWHFGRQSPLGTARGTILINGAVSQGASQIAIDGITPSAGTLLAGDMLGVAGQLFMVASNVTAVAGAATVPIVNRVRVAIADNAAVTWDKPMVLMRMLSTSGVRYFRARTEGVQFEFAEAVA